MASRVSVVMATFNGERHLKAQLDSILFQQSTPPDEIIICDDASTDNTVAVCEQVASRFGGHSFIEGARANRGVHATFARALSLATGDIVFLADQDDVWYPQKIERVVDAFARNLRASLVIHDLDFCDVDLNPIGQTKLERFRELSIPISQYVTGMATAVRRAVIASAYPIADLKATAHDNWLHWVASLHGERVVLDEPLAAYRRHSQNVSRRSYLNSPRVLRRRPIDSRLRSLLGAYRSDSMLKPAVRLNSQKMAWLDRSVASPLADAELSTQCQAALAETQQEREDLELLLSVASAPWLHRMYRFLRQPYALLRVARRRPPLYVIQALFARRVH